MGDTRTAVMDSTANPAPLGLLGLGEASGNATVTMVAGYEGIVCGLSAVYTGLAQVLNELYGRVLVPLGLQKHG